MKTTMNAQDIASALPPVSAQAIAARPLPVTGTYNFRDLGGIPLADGGSMRGGMLFRSDAFHRVDDEGRAKLAELDIVRIVDLRHDEELELMPSAVDRAAIEILHTPVFAAASIGAQVDPGQVLDLAEIYRAMIDTRGPQLALAAHRVVESPGPVVFHCTAGKDRTGVLAALLLDALGARREAVIADYAATADNLSGEWTRAALEGKDIAALEASGVDIVGITTQSPAPLIDSLLGRLDEEFGGAAAYLEAHGFGTEALATARSRFVVR